jgi:endonuclease III
VKGWLDWKPQAMVKLSTLTIKESFYPVGFYKAKADNIK